MLFGQEISGPLDFKVIRNSDFREVSLEVSFHILFTSILIIHVVLDISQHVENNRIA